MAQAWRIGDSINSPAWSISTEWGAYLLFPGLIVITLRAHPVVRVLVAAECMVLLAYVSSLPETAVHAPSYVGPIRFGPLDVWDGATIWPQVRCLTLFTLGLLTWQVWRSKWLSRIATGPIVTAVAIASVVLWCIHGADVLIAASFVALVPALALQRGIAAKFLASSVPFLLGEWSFAIYLLHELVAMLIVPASAFLSAHHIRHGWSVAAVGAVPITLALAWLVHESFEKPARRWLRRSLPWHEQPAGASPARGADGTASARSQAAR
jgi:peptidoglycan/LPS O-acetylase OafA/YrhL